MSGEASHLSSTSEEQSISSPNQEDNSLEDASSSSSLSSSPTIESQGLQFLQQALTMASTKEIIMPDGTKIEVYDQPRQIDKVSEFVQIKSEDSRNLSPKEQADIRATILKKQHSLYDRMDLASTNIDELVGFQANLKSTERHFGRFDLLQVFKSSTRSGTPTVSSCQS
jgi:hypothetical protein